MLFELISKCQGVARFCLVDIYNGGEYWLLPVFESAEEFFEANENEQDKKEK